MKKILSVLVLGIMLAGLVVPVISQAEELPSECKMKYDVGVTECPIKGDDCKLSVQGDVCGLCCLLNTVYTVTSWVFVLMMALAVILIVIGGATYMLATGDPDKAAKGKSIITFAIIGLAIALIARFVPPVVKFIMGVS